MTIADGASAEVPVIQAETGFSVPCTVKDSTGGVWRCIGWSIIQGGDGDGEGPAASIMISSNVTLVWVWEQEVLDDEEEPGGDEPSDEDLVPVPPEDHQLLTIYSNADGSWATVSKVQSNFTGTDLACPTSDGKVELAITFEPSETKKFYKVVVDKEDPTK